MTFEQYQQAIQDPEFANLTFVNQLDLKKELLSQTFSQDPQFASLSPEDQQSLFTSALMSPPALKDPKADAWLKRVIQGVDAGDQKALSELANLSFDTALKSGGLVSNGAARLNQGVWNLIARIKGDGQIPREMLVGSDSTKIQQYLQFKIASDPKLSTMASAAGITGAVAPWLDVMLYNPVMKGTSMLMDPFFSQAAAKAGTRIGTLLKGTVAPALADTFVGGLTNVALQNTKALFDQNPAEYTRTFADIGTTFAQGALFNTVVNMGVRSLMPQVGYIAKRIFGKGVQGLKVSGDLGEYVQAASTIERLPGELKAQLSTAAQDTAWFEQELRQARLRGASDIDLRPYDRTLSAADQMPAVIPRRLEDGSWRLWSLDQEGPKPMLRMDHFKTEDQMLDRLGILAVKEKSVLTKAAPASPQAASLLKTFEETNAWLLARGTALDRINVAMTGKSAIEGVDRSSKFLGIQDRSYVHPAEADLILKGLPETSTGGNITSGAYRVSVPLGKTEAANFVASKSVLGSQVIGESGQMRQFPIDPQGNGLVVVAKAADEAAVKRATQFAQAAKTKGDANPIEALVVRYLTGEGYDGLVVNGPQGKSVVSFMPQTIKWVIPEVDVRTGRILDSAYKAKVASEQPMQASVKASLEQVIPSDLVRKNSVSFSAVLDASTKGQLDAKRLQAVARMITGDAKELKGLRIQLSGTNDVVPKTGRPISRYVMQGSGMGSAPSPVLIVPKLITNPQAQKAFIESFVGEIQGLMRGNEGGSARLSQKTLQALESTRTSLSGISNMPGQFQDAWLDYALKKAGGRITSRAAGRIEAQMPGGAPQVFASNKELIESLARSQVSEASVTTALAEQGLGLQHGADGSWLVQGPKFNAPERFKDLGSITDRYALNTAKLSDKYAPPQVVVDSSSARLTFDGVTMTGGIANITKVLDAFEDTSVRRGKPVIFRDATLTPVVNGAVEVRLPKFGSVLHFETMAQAKQAVAAGFEGFEAQTRLAAKKGLVLDFNPKTGYTVWDGSAKLLAKTPEELAGILKTYEDPVGAPDLFSGLAPQVATELQSVVDAAKAANPELFAKWESLEHNMAVWRPSYYDFEPTGSMVGNLRDQARALMQGFDYYIEKTLPKFGMEGLLKHLRSLRKAIDGRDSMITQDLEAAFGIFKGKSGKLPKVDRLQTIFYHMGAQTEEEKALAVLAHGRLTTEETQIAEKARGLYDQLFKRFRVDPKLYLTNYQPRIKDWIMAEPNRQVAIDSLDGRASELIDKIYGGQAPQDLQAFFQHERASEVLKFAVDDNALSVMIKYIKAGNKQYFMNQPWSELTQFMELNKESIPPGVFTRIERYRLQSVDAWTVPGMDIAEKFGMAFKQFIGGGAASPESIAAGRDALRAYFSMGYLTNMGFRPVSAIRNYLQLYSTFAARFGNEAVDVGLRKVMAFDESYLTKLRRLNVISGVPPVVNELATEGSTLGKITTKALKWFKNSDDLSRAVAYAGIEERLLDSVSKLERGIFKNDEAFLKYSGLNLIQKTAPDTVQEVLNLIKSRTNDTEAVSKAAYVFSSKVVNETMFDWNSANAPMLYSNSLLSKMFGQYGTYSAGYRANIYRGLTNGDFGDKVAFLTRFIGNNLVIKAAFNAVGIKALDFIPGRPALFGGGPNFTYAIDLMKAASADQTGAQARADLFRSFLPVVPYMVNGELQLKLNIPTALPGMQQLKSWGKIIDYSNAGDTYGMILAATATPQEYQPGQRP
jgi:hypothetical protein